MQNAADSHSLSLPGELRSVARIFDENGFQLYLVGGAVRNLLRGYYPEDYDLATDARPEEVMRIFRRVIPTGVQHGTVTVLFKGKQFEVTTFRSESGYSDARHPDEVTFGVDIEIDLSRRDFTINGMALEVKTGALLDPFEGRSDLERGLVRAIGNPRERFDEDALRVLRAIRFATQLGFKIEDATAAALQGRSAALTAVSVERTRDELSKIILAPRPSYGLRLMREFGLLSAVTPELSRCAGHPVAEAEDELLEHLLRTCDAVAEAKDANLELRLAALLHELALPECSEDQKSPDELAECDTRSAEKAQDCLRRLRYPNNTIERVAHLVRYHRLQFRPNWSDAAVRRVVAAAGVEQIYDAIALRRADLRSRGCDERAVELNSLVARVREIRERGDPLTLRELAVNGNDLAAHGVPRGPQMGRVLEELLQRALEDPALNSRRQLLELATELLNVT